MLKKKTLKYKLNIDKNQKYKNTTNYFQLSFLFKKKKTRKN